MGGGKARRLLNLIFPGNQFQYNRSFLFKILTERLIKKAVNRFEKADLCIFTNFDFYNKFNKNIPTLLFCDWTYKILILDHLGRSPYPFERKFPLWQEEAIKHAALVISLFPTCAAQMKLDYPTANIHHLGRNVINSIYEGPHDIESFIAEKLQSNRIVFVGKNSYLKGLRLLIEAMTLLRSRYDLSLDVIGMTKEEVGNDLPWIRCHGYLRKDDEKERNIYYKTIIGAKLFVNPSEVWGGYSSTIEAMYFATPVVVSPYKDFVEEFGNQIDFGQYNRVFDAESLAETMLSVMENPQYPSICRCAYDRVKDYSWDVYVDKILELL